MLNNKWYLEFISQNLSNVADERTQVTYCFLKTTKFIYLFIPIFFPITIFGIVGFVVLKWMSSYACPCGTVPVMQVCLLTKVFSGSCWDSEDSMVVLIQSQARQRCSDDCISVRREKQRVTTTRQYYNICVPFLSLSNFEGCVQKSVI